MSKLKRISDTRTTYFITTVTYNRQPILVENVDLIWKAIDSVRSKTPFELIAWVILPDHIHLILDTLGNDISNLIQRFKMSFGKLYLKRIRQKSGRVWQNRFWDHIIRDEQDLKNHLDYIHFNPTKHGLANSPFEWKESSVHGFSEQGYYSDDWSVKEIDFQGEFGE